MSDNSAPPDLSSNQHTADPPGYELFEEVGRGGMGVVYRACDLALRRDVAVKILRDRFPPGSAVLRRFLDEAYITGQLQHPGIPAVHQVGSLPDGRPFLAMKLIKGRTLDELLQERPDPSADRSRFLAVFEQVCQAVGYSHVHQVIHRDLKPANVMIGAFGEVQVMDWGLAKVLVGGGACPRCPDGDPGATIGTEIRSTRGDEAATQAGSLLGTPAYMPPEQAIGAVDQVDERSDVFSLGAILCVILTGKPPYVGADAESTRQLAARAKLDDAFTRLDACGAEPELVSLAKRCLAVERANRPANAGEVAKAVAGLRAAADERARKAELDRVRAEGEQAKAEAEAREQRKRRRVQLALAGAVLLLLAAGGMFAWWADRQATARRVETENRERDERERRTRNADAVAVLLGQCEAALRANNAEKAGLALEQAEARAAEGGTDPLQERFDHCLADLAMLRELNVIDDFRWFVVENKLPEDKAVVARWQTAFAGYGVVPGETPVDETVSRLTDSFLRDRLLATLNLWLVRVPSPGLKAILQKADPDPYRDAVRDAVAATDNTRVAELAGQPKALAQPPGFAAALGQYEAGILAPQRRLILETALRSRPKNLSLLMALGHTYPINQREGADERLRWYQAAVAAHPRSVPAYNQLGIALCDKGDNDGAIAEYKEIIRLEPKYAPLHNNLAVALAAKEDLDGAISEYKEAIRLNPKGAVNYYNNLGGLLLQKKKDFDGAIAAYKDAIRLDPKNARAHNNLIAALKAKSGPEAAIAEYRKVIGFNPKDAQAHTTLGNALRDKKDRDGAIAEYKLAVSLDPKLTDAHFNLGNALRDKKDFDGAIAAYRAALRLNPTNGEGCLYHIRACYVAKGDPDGAVKTAREAVQLYPTAFATHHGLGDALQFLKHDSAAAVAAYRKAIRLNPIHTWSHNNLGTALRNTGDLDGAIKEFKEAIRLDPKFTAAYTNLFNALRDKKGLDGAIAAFKELILHDPKNAASREILGTALRDKGDLNGAIAALKEAIRLEPRSAGPRRELSLTLKAKGDVEAAVEAGREAVRLAPKWAPALTALGEALTAKGDLDEAAVVLRKAVDLDPKYFWSQVSLSRILRTKGDYDGAIALCREAVRFGPNNFWPHEHLGHALWAKRDWNGAITSYNVAIRLNPKAGHIHSILARLLATGPNEVRDGKRAVKHATQACELTGWKNCSFIDTLAAAYAEVGEFYKAVEYQKKALAVSNPSWEKGEGKDAHKRLELYTQKKPYRDPALASSKHHEVAPPSRNPKR